MFLRRTATACLTFCCLTLLTGMAWSQAAGSPGAARDMFRKASSRFGKPAETAAAKPPAPATSTAAAPKPAAPKTAAPTATPKPPAQAPEAETVRRAQPPVETVQQAPPPPPTIGGATATLVTSRPLEPLGLRYSLVKQVGSSEREVDADTVFRSGERIKLHLQASDNAYLYLVLKGSSGRWRVLFPSPEIDGGDNRVEPETTYVVPNNPKAWFAFDDQVGEEQLFILLSRQPQPDLERMIYDLRRGSGQPTAPNAPAPAAQPSGGKVMMASAQQEVDDVMIAGLRQTAYSRDLVFEKVEDDEQEPEWKKAVYIVDKDASPNARLVADVKLKHQ